MKDGKVFLKSLEDLKSGVTKLVAHLSSRQIVLLEGPLGAGKTKTVEFFINALGGSGASSPTFAIHQVYSTKSGDADHVDLYRLEDENDLDSSGFWEIFEKPVGLVFIEWSDRLRGDWFPPGWNIIRLQFCLNEDDTRTLSWSRVR